MSTSASSWAGADGADPLRERAPVALPAVFDIVHRPELRRFVQWYLRCRGVHDVMRTSALDPMAFKAMLSRVYYYDYDPESGIFRLRLAGEEIRRMLPSARRGATLAEVIPQKAYEAVLDRYQRVVQERAIHHGIGRVYIGAERSGYGERIVVPLADDDAAVRQIFGVTFYSVGSYPLAPAYGEDEQSNAFLPLHGIG